MSHYYPRIHKDGMLRAGKVQILGSLCATLEPDTHLDSLALAGRAVDGHGCNREMPKAKNRLGSYLTLRYT